MTSAARGARIVVVGGGLAGMAAALRAADAGAQVTLVEKRRHLGGLTWSFERRGLSFDNGQHVFLRCCDAYQAFLVRIGAADQVHLQRRLDVPVVSPTRTSHIRRSARSLPSPFHLAPSLLAYGHLSVAERVRLGRAVRALRSIDLEDPSLDNETFGEWLAAHAQSPRALERLWDLVTLPTVNLTAAEASLALGAKVFRTGLLDTVDGADIGWATVPLGQLHGANGARALERAGVSVTLDTPAREICQDTGHGTSVTTDAARIAADAVIVALSHDATAHVVPEGTVGDITALGTSPIVNVHLVLDRRVTDLDMAAALTSPVQYVFDRTATSGLRTPGAQLLAVSLSSATAWVGARPEDLIATFHEAIGHLFPKARSANLLDAVVTKEHTATFRAVPGTARLRPHPTSATRGVFLAGAWCATGWPSTMEGAVRSGNAAADAALASVSAEPVPQGACA